MVRVKVFASWVTGEETHVLFTEIPVFMALIKDKLPRLPQRPSQTISVMLLTESVVPDVDVENVDAFHVLMPD